MGILLGFLPFIAFSVLEERMGPANALVVGALVALILLIKAWRQPPHTIKILEAGTVVLMGALAIYAMMAKATLSLVAVRCCVDAGLLLIVVLSMVIRQPFTIQYARQQVDPALWGNPRFLRTNYVITGAWAAAFAVMTLAEAAMLASPAIPHTIGFGVVIAAIAAALGFTMWRSKQAATERA